MVRVMTAIIREATKSLVVTLEELGSSVAQVVEPVDKIAIVCAKKCSH